MEIYPSEVKKEADGLGITWSSGQSVKISADNLRRNCPCAACRKEESLFAAPAPADEKKSRSLRVVADSVEVQTRLVRVWSVGNYAIGLEWADGHKTGIYTYELLQALCGLKQ